jgi:hypothetical protein
MSVAFYHNRGLQHSLCSNGCSKVQYVVLGHLKNTATFSILPDAHTKLDSSSTGGSLLISTYSLMLLTISRDAQDVDMEAFLTTSFPP